MMMKGQPSRTDLFDRMLAYRVRYSGWVIFKSVYWAIYSLLLGFILLFYTAQNTSISLQTFLGLALTIFALMLILYGAVEVLHNKLMRTYA